MYTAIVLSTLANIFAISPDLCADVLLDPAGVPYQDAGGSTFSRYCEWTEPEPPVWGQDVCSTIDSSAHCIEPSVGGRCAVGFKMWCEYGELIGDAVTCYQPFPAVGEENPSGEVLPPDPPPQEDLVCYQDGVYTEIYDEQGAIDCVAGNGYVWWCTYGYENTDGTIDCLY